MSEYPCCVTVQEIHVFFFLICGKFATRNVKCTNKVVVCDNGTGVQG